MAMADGLTQEEYLAGNNRVDAECIKSYRINSGIAGYKARFLEDTFDGVRPVAAPLLVS